MSISLIAPLMKLELTVCYGAPLIVTGYNPKKTSVRIDGVDRGPEIRIEWASSTSIVSRSLWSRGRGQIFLTSVNAVGYKSFIHEGF